MDGLVLHETILIGWHCRAMAAALIGLEKFIGGLDEAIHQCGAGSIATHNPTAQDDFSWQSHQMHASSGRASLPTGQTGCVYMLSSEHRASSASNAQMFCNMPQRFALDSIAG
jgi:hypothetical protein